MGRGDTPWRDKRHERRQKARFVKQAGAKDAFEALGVAYNQLRSAMKRRHPDSPDARSVPDPNFARERVLDVIAEMNTAADDLYHPQRARR